MIKQILLASTILFSTFSVFAQEEKSVDDLQSSTLSSVDKDYQDWLQNSAIPGLQKKCQEKGISLSNPACTEESLIYGEGTVTVTQQDPNWIDNRYLAYTEALLDAYKNVAEAIALNVETEVQHNLLQDTKEPELEIKKETKFKVILDKLVALANGAIDKKLDELGIDPKKYKEADNSAKKDMFRDTILNTTIKRSNAEISGMVPLQTFEGRDDGGNYVIRVVVSTDPERVSLVKSILTTGENIAPDISKAKKSVRERIIVDSATLFNQFGTKIMYDEEGYPVLIAFGQAGIKNGTSSSQNSIRLKSARTHALSRADSALTLLLNGNIESKNITSEIKQHLEQVILTEDNENGKINRKETTTDSYDELINDEIKTSGKISNFAGRRQIHTWIYEHPETKQKATGVVLVWSPKTAKMTNDIRYNRKQTTEEKPAETNINVSTPSKVIRGIESDF